jgi:hypothetical protein
MHYYNPLTHHVQPIEGTNDWRIIRNDNPQLGSRVSEKPEPEIPFELTDDGKNPGPDKKGRIRFHEVVGKVIVIAVEGYGTCCPSIENELIEISQASGKLQVGLWADINQEEVTHLVDMEGARLDRRKPQDKSAITELSTDELITALQESLKLQRHYAKLINMHDGGERATWDGVSDAAMPEVWIQRLRETGAL